MEAFSEVTEQSRTPRDRNHAIPRPSPPRPPMPYSSVNKENDSLANGKATVTKKLSNAKEKPAVPTTSPTDGGNIQLARAGETVLETFYGMLYKCEDETKEWKLAANGFIPLCFIQERGNASKPFKVIAAHGSVRVMDFPVTEDTKCSQNKAFVRWHDSPIKMYGVRFAKESQANQFYSAMSRMNSTLLKTAELLKQPERKAMVSHISDPTVEGVSHTKISLIVKLPNNETTIMTVPGLISIGELFDLICKKENLTSYDHQLTLPKVGKGGKELKYGPDTVLGSLKIREVFITYTAAASSDSTVEGSTSPKEPKTSVTTMSAAHPRPHSSYQSNHAIQAIDKKSTSPLAQSDEQLDKQNKEPVKVKRRAPPPPQLRPERPKSMPIPRPRTVESTSYGPPPAPPQAKKRQAPARPPAPRISRDDGSIKLKSDGTDERLPPEFCPPPPPDDVPPPLDECEHPVSPLSEEDLHETWMTSDHNTSFKEEESQNVAPSHHPLSPTGDSQELPSPGSIPLKFLLPSSEGENDDTIEREGQSSRISFVGDSRSSSVDISSDNDILTSPTLEEFKPTIDLQEIEASATDEEPRSMSPPPPPSDFSNEVQNDEPSGNVDLQTAFGQDIEVISAPPPPDFNENENLSNVVSSDIESMVVPPPPIMFDDSPEERDVISKESNIVLESGFSIPPPSDFAEEADESSDKFDDEGQTTKKKLGLSGEMFPWISESQPAFQAEVSSTRVERVEREAPLNESESFNEKHSSSTMHTLQKESIVIRDVDDSALHSLPVEVMEKETTKSSNNNDIQIPSSNIEHSKEADKYNNDKDPHFVKSLSSDTDVAREILTVPDIKDRLLPKGKEHHKSVSSDEGSSSYKTPFDDLGSIETSEDSLASEFEDDFPVDVSLYQNEKETFQSDKSSKLSSSSNVDENILQNNQESSEKSISAEPMVESSSATPIAIPVDILFQSLDQSSSNVEVNSSQNNEKNRQQSQNARKRPISSGFKTQSWADIKNQEKRMEQDKHKNIESTKVSEKVLPPPEKTASAKLPPHENTASTELKTLPLEEKKEIIHPPAPEPAPVFKSAWDEIKYQEKLMEEERQRKISSERMSGKTTSTDPTPSVTESVATFTASTEGTLSSSTAPNKPRQETQIYPRKPVSYVSSALEKRSSNTSFSQNTSSNFSGRTYTVPSSKSSVTSFSNEKSAPSTSTINATVESSNEHIQSTVSNTDDSQSSSEGVQGVVMRKKAGKQHDTVQKRKSVQDMMKMFGKEEEHDQERRDSGEINPRQSPALRLLEEKMGYRERSSSDVSSKTSGTILKHSATLGSTSETNVLKSSLVVESKNDKTKSETSSTTVTDIKTNSDVSVTKEAGVVKETAKSKSRDTDSSSIRLRTNSLNPKPYGVLFSKEQKSSSKVTKSNESTVEAKKNETDLSNKQSKQNPKAYDVLFPKGQKASETSAETKRPNESDVESKRQVESTIESKVLTKTQSMPYSVEKNPSPNTDLTEQLKTKEKESKQLQRVNSEPSKTNVTVEQQKSKVAEERTHVTSSSTDKEERPTIAGDSKQVENKAVELRKKESVSDPTKRHSMPVNLVESTSSTSQGKNLKILLAPQISDIGVVPKGRVAAMKAAWKSDDQ